MNALPDYDVIAASRVRSLLAQMKIARADAAALLRSIANELDEARADEHMRAAAEREAMRLRDLGFTVGPAPMFAISTRAVAHLLGRAHKTVRAWRCDACGPAWSSDGAGRVSYSLIDVLAWRDVSRVVPIKQAADVL